MLITHLRLFLADSPLFFFFVSDRLTELFCIEKIDSSNDLAENFYLRKGWPTIGYSLKCCLIRVLLHCMERLYPTWSRVKIALFFFLSGYWTSRCVATVRQPTPSAGAQGASAERLVEGRRGAANLPFPWPPWPTCCTARQRSYLDPPQVRRHSPGFLLSRTSLDFYFLLERSR